MSHSRDRRFHLEDSLTLKYGKGYCIAKVSLHPESCVSDKKLKNCMIKITTQFKSVPMPRYTQQPDRPARGAGKMAWRQDSPPYLLYSSACNSLFLKQRCFCCLSLLRTDSKSWISRIPQILVKSSFWGLGPLMIAFQEVPMGPDSPAAWIMRLGPAAFWNHLQCLHFSLGGNGPGRKEKVA